MNILFSSTVQWNVGDEFILRGVMSALREAGVSFNPVLFNRNPAVSTPWNPRWAWPRRPYAPPENSAQLTADDPVDYVIFAGTPEWTSGVRASRLHEFILRRKLRCAFLGVGLGNAVTPDESLSRILRDQTDLFMARDQLALAAASPHVAAEKCSCPAILCCAEAEPRPARPRKVGLVIQADQTLWQSVPTKVMHYLLQQYREISARYETVYIAHYLDDLKLAQKLGLPCRYSFRAEDYEGLFKDCDLVVTARVHGAGIAASLGIPSILIAHDGRAETGTGFGAIVTPPDTELLPLIESTDWAQRSQDIIALKHSVRATYVAKLRAIPALGVATR